ncbi:MAG: stage II sporulation protein P [Clostridiales bacterium]|nr:stage II sporulation protein P [Clostridiales bacterium]
MRRRRNQKRARYQLKKILAGTLVLLITVWLFQRAVITFVPAQEQKSGSIIQEELSYEPVFTSLAGVEDIIYQPETDPEMVEEEQKKAEPPAPKGQPVDMAKVQDKSYVKNKYYIIDRRTDLTENLIDIPGYLSKDFALDSAVKEPQVLIFHTHSCEGFVDSDMSKGMEEGIYGAGERLKQLLKEKYGINAIHHNGQYDVVNGKNSILGAYERMEPDIQQILKENPSIQVVIDMHRDGVAEDTKLVTEVNGKPCAQIMFFNGICQLYQDGVVQPLTDLPNPYVKDNLAFSFQMKAAADELYPGFARKIYVNAYRYSLHMRPRSTLIEVGAQTNTKEEIWNAMEPLADILATVLQ